MALLFLLMAVPLTEIALFLVIGDWIGTVATLGCVVVTAIAGAVLLRQQGVGTLRRAQDAIDRGEMPLDALFDGLCVFLSGAFLLTPGFLTDGLGFLLLAPPSRAAFKRVLMKRLSARATVRMARSAEGRPGGRAGAQPPPGKEAPTGTTPSDKPIIDADFTEIPAPPDRDQGA